MPLDDVFPTCSVEKTLVVSVQRIKEMASEKCFCLIDLLHGDHFPDEVLLQGVLQSKEANMYFFKEYCNPK